MQRDEIVRVLRETAALLELEGESVFRVRAYENAARTFKGVVEEPQDLLEEGRLAELPGIGPGLVASVAELAHTGRLSLHEELRAKYPPGLLDLFRVSGLGPKRIRVLFRELAVDSPKALEQACLDDRVASLPGFGAKSQVRILDSVRALERYAERRLVSDAAALAEPVLGHLRASAGVVRAEIAGSLRRSLETIGDLDFVAAVAAEDRAAVALAFEACPEAQEVVSHGDTKLQVRLVGGAIADLRMVEEDEFAAAWLHYTGSKEHNVALRARAKKVGRTLNEYGLFEGERRLESADEVALYRHLGLPWVPPEMREGLDEIERAEAGPIPDLVALEDLRGTLHVHSTWSDGMGTIEQMAKAAADHGWEYLGIADHSKSAAYAGGLDAERVREQWREIDAWNEAGKRPFLFKGSEVDILADGALDFDDDLLLGFDFVVASVHSLFRLSRAEQTARIVRAVRHPCVTFLGHATGRLLLAREGYDLDLDEVLDAAEEAGVIVELNASPHRLDLDWRYLRERLVGGARTSIHPDAHSPQGLADVRWGVGAARKAGAERTAVLNTGTTAQLTGHFEARRTRARRELGRASA